MRHNVGSKMNTKEKIYTGLVITWGVFLLFGFLTLLTLIYPNAESKAVFQMILATELLMAAVYFVTAGLNLKAGSLTTVNTTVQIATLFLCGYGAPLAIWGIILLRKRICQPVPAPYSSLTEGPDYLDRQL